jgi:uncharacterized protein YbjT (DUF2867 family)
LRTGAAVRSRCGRQHGEPFVDADDIADVAVAALTDDAREVVRLTAPTAADLADAVREITDATGLNAVRADFDGSVRPAGKLGEPPRWIC